jgi:hypothetical protein
MDDDTKGLERAGEIVAAEVDHIPTANRRELQKRAFIRRVRSGAVPRRRLALLGLILAVVFLSGFAAVFAILCSMGR